MLDDFYDNDSSWINRMVNEHLFTVLMVIIVGGFLFGYFSAPLVIRFISLF